MDTNELRIREKYRTRYKGKRCTSNIVVNVNQMCIGGECEIRGSHSDFCCYVEMGIPKLESCNFETITDNYLEVNFEESNGLDVVPMPEVYSMDENDKGKGFNDSRLEECDSDDGYTMFKGVKKNKTLNPDEIFLNNLNNPFLDSLDQDSLNIDIEDKIDLEIEKDEKMVNSRKGGKKSLYGSDFSFKKRKTGNKRTRDVSWDRENQRSQIQVRENEEIVEVSEKKLLSNETLFSEVYTVDDINSIRIFGLNPSSGSQQPVSVFFSFVHQVEGEFDPTIEPLHAHQFEIQLGGVIVDREDKLKVKRNNQQISGFRGARMILYFDTPPIENENILKAIQWNNGYVNMIMRLGGAKGSLNNCYRYISTNKSGIKYSNNQYPNDDDDDDDEQDDPSNGKFNREYDLEKYQDYLSNQNGNKQKDNTQDSNYLNDYNNFGLFGYFINEVFGKSKRKVLHFDKIGDKKLNRGIRMFKRKVDCFNFDLVMHLIARGCSRVVMKCMKSNNFKWNHIDAFGNTYLHWSYYYNNHDLVNYFSKHISSDIINWIGKKPCEFVLKGRKTVETIELPSKRDDDYNPPAGNSFGDSISGKISHKVRSLGVLRSRKTIVLDKRANSYPDKVRKNKKKKKKSVLKTKKIKEKKKKKKVKLLEVPKKEKKLNGKKKIKRKKKKKKNLKFEKKKKKKKVKFESTSESESVSDSDSDSGDEEDINNLIKQTLINKTPPINKTMINKTLKQYESRKISNNVEGEEDTESEESDDEFPKREKRKRKKKNKKRNRKKKKKISNETYDDSDEYVLVSTSDSENDENKVSESFNENKEEYPLVSTDEESEDDKESSQKEEEEKEEQEEEEVKVLEENEVEEVVKVDESILKDVTKESVEGRNILQLIEKRGLKEISSRVISIKHVYNKEMEKNFLDMKNSIKTNIQSELFFVVDENQVENIVQKGLTSGFMKRKGCAYGYVLFKSSKVAIENAEEIDEKKTLVVCKAILGDYTKVDLEKESNDNKVMIKPPMKPSKDDEVSKEEFDSVCNNSDEPTIWVLFKQYQTIPTYLVEYK